MKLLRAGKTIPYENTGVTANSHYVKAVDCSLEYKICKYRGQTHGAQMSVLASVQRESLLPLATVVLYRLFQHNSTSTRLSQYSALLQYCIRFDQRQIY